MSKFYKLDAFSLEGYITEYKYDPVGNLEKRIDPLTGETVMRYDAVNRLIERTLPNGVKTVYEYKENTDFVEKITHWAADGVTVLNSVEYERADSGEPTKITRDDGSYVRLDYDEALRVEKESYYDADGNFIEEIGYSYDELGNREVVTNGWAQGSYRYENINQLQQIETDGGIESYTYDAGGRIETITRDGETLRLDYNTDDQLTKVTDENGNVIVEYEYDSQGRRVEAIDGLGERDYLVAPMMGGELESPHLIVSGGEDVAAFVYAGLSPLMRLDENGEPVYYLMDGMGSAIGLVDGSGQEVASFEYDSFGNLRGLSGTEAEVSGEMGGDFRFQGQWLESSTDFYHFRARYYDPQTGRFLSRDPVELLEYEPESSNPYQFAYNNPHVYSDPSGEITLNEAAIRNHIENILQTMKRSTNNKRWKKAIDEARGTVGELVQDFLENLVPVSDRLEGFYDTVALEGAAALGAIGDPFEMLIVDVILCPVLGAANLSHWFWREVPIMKDTGRPRDNSYQCGQPKSPMPSGVTPSTASRPDIVISSFPPLEMDLFRRAWLIGDVKGTVNAVKDKMDHSNSHHSYYSHNQWDAMKNFALRHQYIPIVSFVTLFDDTNKRKKQLKKQASNQGVLLRFVPILIDRTP